MSQGHSTSVEPVMLANVAWAMTFCRTSKSLCGSVISSGQMNDSHPARNVMTAIVATAGAARGIAIEKKIRPQPAPSTMAASMTSSGTREKN